jgi:hypothetical protein
MRSKNGRKEMALIALYLFVLSMVPVAMTIWFAKTCVKLRRAKKWVADHPGVLVGDKEFFEWCDSTGVDPRYYF